MDGVLSISGSSTSKNEDTKNVDGGCDKIFTITDFHSCDDDLYWYGCYDSFKDWKKFVTPESFAHPAKMSPVLCDRIFKHLKKHNLLKEGDTIVDFMAGINTTGIMATIHGCNSIAIELEPHFISMINANKEQIERRSGREINWEIIKGDSRNLSELLEDKGFVGVVSPPYSGVSETSQQTSKKVIEDRIKRGIAGAVILPDGKCMTGDGKRKEEYSSDPSNIGNLQDKSLVGITSPPFLQAQSGGGIAIEGYRGKHIDEMGKNQPDKVGQRCGYMREVHGESLSNIGNLPDKQLIGVVSPPYNKEEHSRTKKQETMQEQFKGRSYIEGKEYSPDPDNIGNQGDESYLSAMLKVYQEAYKSGISPLVTVTKNPTRGGKLRRLDLDTINLLLVVGYRILDYHRAVLFEERKQMTFDGEIKNIPKGRLSFFKRLSYDKGNVVARWEDIIIAVI